MCGQAVGARDAECLRFAGLKARALSFSQKKKTMAGALATAARVPAALVWAIIYLLRWVETRFLHPLAAFFIDDVTAAWEEGAKSLVRESFAALTRGANGATAWLLSLLVDRRYWRTLRAEGARSRRGVAWEAYWREARPSTLNAVVARAVRGSTGEEGKRMKRGGERMRRVTPWCSPRVVRARGGAWARARTREEMRRALSLALQPSPILHQQSPPPRPPAAPRPRLAASPLRKRRPPSAPPPPPPASTRPCPPSRP